MDARGAHIQHSTTTARCNIALVGAGRRSAKKATRVAKHSRVVPCRHRRQKPEDRAQIAAFSDNIRTALQ